MVVGGFNKANSNDTFIFKVFNFSESIKVTKDEIESTVTTNDM